MKSRGVGLALALLLSGLTSKALGQQRPGQEEASPVELVAVTVVAKIGSKSYHASGRGSCRHDPDAALDDGSASVWVVHYDNQRNGGVKQLALSLRRPKDGGPDQLLVELVTGSGSSRIETAEGREPKGEATVTILPSGPGGRLEVTGKDSGGKSIEVTIDCPAFAAIDKEND